MCCHSVGTWQGQVMEMWGGEYFWKNLELPWRLPYQSGLARRDWSELRSQAQLYVLFIEGQVQIL